MSRVTYIHADVLEGLGRLADNSQHCVITSPPYYGLRSYGIPPSIWGGDPACEHAWKDEVIPTEAGRGNWAQAVNGRGEAQGDIADFREPIRDKATRGFCEKCHAWRGHFGLEPTYQLFVKHMVLIFREVRRVLRPDGVCWLNLGDSYANGTNDPNSFRRDKAAVNVPGRRPQPGLKPKDLMMIPERVAIALQDDGWWIRSRCPWIKRNAMPESATDRPANATEYVFLLTKSERYFYDKWAVMVPASEDSHARAARGHSGYQAPGQSKQSGTSGARPNRRQKPVAGWATGAGDHSVLEHNQPQGGTTKLLRAPGVHPKAAAPSSGVKSNESFSAAVTELVSGRNRRNTDWFFESWQGMLTDEEGLPLAFVVNPQGFKGAHFATFPAKLIEPMILAGTSEKGCCPSCGAQWVRIVEKGAQLQQWQKACGADSNGEYNGAAVKDYAGTGAQNASEVKARILAGMRERATKGWKPTCKCAAAEPVPCTVLDIFGGSGTVGLVAQRNHRNAVLIEVGEQYVTMGRDRIIDDAPLLAQVDIE